MKNKTYERNFLQIFHKISSRHVTIFSTRQTITNSKQSEYFKENTYLNFNNNYTYQLKIFKNYALWEYVPASRKMDQFWYLWEKRFY